MADSDLEVREGPALKKRNFAFSRFLGGPPYFFSILRKIGRGVGGPLMNDGNYSRASRAVSLAITQEVIGDLLRNGERDRRQKDTATKYKVTVRSRT